MFIFCAGILYLIAAILGLWSASLLWRAWHSWRLQRRGKMVAAKPTGRISGVRRGFGVGVALAALPIAGVAFALGGVVRHEGAADSPIDYGDVVLQGLGAVLAFLALGGFYVARRFDPSMGRRRCPKCWYDMSATGGLLCSECGFTSPGEKAMYRTRRAPRIALLAIVFLVCGDALYTLPEVLKKGWAAAVPTSALIIGLPWWPDAYIAGGPGSLHERVRAERLSGWEKRLLERRCRGMIRESSDLSVVGLAAMAMAECGAESQGLSMNPAAQLAFFKAFQSDLAKGRTPRIALVYAAHFLPPQLPPEVCVIALPAVSAALNSGFNAHFGVIMAPSLGSEATPIVPALSALATSASPIADPGAAIRALAQLGERNDAAWEAYLKVFESPVDAARADAAIWAQHVGRKNEAVTRRLATALSDQSDDVAYAAACSLAGLGGSACNVAQSLAPLVRTRPAALRDMFDQLIQGCPSADVVEGVRIQLLTRRQQGVERALKAVPSLGSMGEPLLPTLRQLRDEGVLSGLYQLELTHAIDMIEAFVRTRDAGKR